jgi:hypothetical protein
MHLEASADKDITRPSAIAIAETGFARGVAIFVQPGGPELGFGACLVFAPKAPGLVNEGQCPGNFGPTRSRALKGPELG